LGDFGQVFELFKPFLNQPTLHLLLILGCFSGSVLVAGLERLWVLLGARLVVLLLPSLPLTFSSLSRCSSRDRTGEKE